MKRASLFLLAIIIACFAGACERHAASELETEASHPAANAREGEEHHVETPKSYETQAVPGGFPKPAESAPATSTATPAPKSF